jgi:hypothetical protein
MGGRHALVIGSQCGGLPNLPLSFLPDAAMDLFQVLVDPERGACDPDASSLLLDPDLSAMVSAVGDAVAEADAAAATLLLVFIGHGEAYKDDLYLLPTNGTSPASMFTGFLFGQGLAELVRTVSGLDGLIVLVDACQSGTGVADLAQRASAEISAAGLRVQLVTSTFDQAARDGCFTKTLTSLLRDGAPGLSRDYLLADNEVLALIAGACGAQDPPRTAMFQGRWRVNDPGLFLGRNPAAGEAWVLAGTAAGGHAVELTRDFQVTDALTRVVDACRVHRVVVLSGGAGSGKSAVVGALARPEVAPDIIAPGFMAAVAFAETSVDVVGVAGSLRAQLARLPGFLVAAQEYAAIAGEGELDQQDALTRLVVGPLRRLRVVGARRVRLAVDGLDQLQESDRLVLFSAVSAMGNDPELAGVRVVLAGRPGSLPDAAADQAVVEFGGAPAEVDLRQYLLQRAVPGEAVPAITAHAGSWLDAKLLADLAASVHDTLIGSSLANVPTTLGELYERAVSAAGARVGDVTVVDAALDILAAAGSGPVLPLGLFADAREEAATGNATGPPARDLLVQLSGLVVRAKPGTPDEVVGLVHDTLREYLTATPQRGEAKPERHGHTWILAVLERDAASGSPRYSRYGRTAKADHLWAAGRTEEALAWVAECLGPQPSDNLAVLRPWLDRCTLELGRDHASTLALRGGVAYWTGEVGDVGGARDLYAALLEDRKRVLGSDHPATLKTRNNLASSTGEAGDAVGARDLFAALLEDRTRVLGADHPSTLTTRSNLASWTGEVGDAVGARDMFAALLEDRTRVLGADHPDTLGTRSNLASWTGEVGDAVGARDLLAALLEDELRVLGAEHPTTLTTRSNLASWTGEVGDAVGARNLSAALLEDRTRVLGADHPATLVTRNNVASWTGRAGDAAGARDLFAALLEDRTRVLGADHPDTLATRNNLGSWTGRAGDAAGARALFTALLPDQTRVLGEDHPATLITHGNIAAWTGEVGDAATARDLFAALLEDHSRVLGADHPTTLTTRSNLAAWTGELGSAAGARRLFATLLQDRTRVLGPDHPDTLGTRSNLASWTGEAGDAKGARDLLAALLEDYSRVLGVDHPDTLGTRSNLGSWTGEAGDAVGARDLFEALLEDYSRVLGVDHPDTLTTRSNLASWTGRAGDAVGARDLFEALLEDYSRVLGLDHPDTLATRNTLAHLTGDLGDTEGGAQSA